MNRVLLIVFLSCHFTTSTSIRSKDQNVLQQSTTHEDHVGWATCTSCNIDKPKTSSQIQDVNDNIDFHFDHFIKELKGYFSEINQDLDNSYILKVQRSSDCIIDELQHIKATIKENYNEVSDKISDKNFNSIIEIVNNKAKTSKNNVSEFVKNGLESFKHIFQKLYKEFTLDNKNSPKNVSGNPGEINKNEGVNDKNMEPDQFPSMVNVPFEAILRTMDSYLIDLKTEGNKLIKETKFLGLTLM